jgi:diguanylate cyclase (GGDEF)-like protein/PAS domain S-box-containing protein
MMKIRAIQRARQKNRPQSNTHERAPAKRWAQITRLLPSHISVVITDPHGNIEYVNSRFTEITGYSLNEIAGQTLRLLKSGTHPSDLFQELWETISQGREWRGELCNRKKNGELYWVWATIVPIKNARNKITHFIALQEDLADRKQVAQDLTESEAHFRALFHHGLEGVYRISSDGKLLAANPGLVRMLGYESEAELSHTDIGYQLFRATGQPEERARELDRNGELRNIEVSLTRKDGQCIIVLCNAYAVRNPNGKLLYLEGTLTDITEHKHNEEELARYAAILNAVNYAAEQFLRVPSWRDHIQPVIARLGRATRVSRVYIFENRRDEKQNLYWRQLYEWTANGITPQIDNPLLQHLDIVQQGFGRWITLMEQGEVIKGRVKDLPPSEQSELIAEEIKSIVCVPIYVKQTWWGLIGFDDCLTEREWSAAELDALVAAANTLGAAIEREQMDQELHRRVSELEAIRQASLSLTSSLDLSAVLDAIVESALHLVAGAKDAHIYLYQDQQLNFGTSLWINGSKGQQWSSPRPNGLTYTVARTGQTIVVPDMRTHPLFTSASWQGAIIGLPLKIAQRVVGVMTIACPSPRDFSENELRSLDLLATQAAIAIENASLYDQVQQLAITDALTNIYNRRGFFQIGEGEVERARRFGHPLSVLMFDLDHFKQINDTFGHPFGDKILVALIETCRRYIRALDILGRYGGEEFVALLPETDLPAALQIAERLRHAVEKTPLYVGDKTIFITISIGVATFRDKTMTLTDMVEQADQAMYRAKQAGRNRVEAYQ